MKILNWEQLDDNKEFFSLPSGISAGSFDGIHQGHRELLKTLVENCRKNNYVPGVLTFTRPLPSIKHSDDYKGDISTLNQRLKIFEELGIEFVIIVDFKEAFSSLSGKQFLDILKNKCRMKLLAEGIDFRCGYKGATDASAIRYWAAQNEVTAVFVEPVYFKPGTEEEERVSSSFIRSMILKGFCATASEMLERPYQLDFSSLTPHPLPNTPHAELPLSQLHQVLPPAGIYNKNNLRLEIKSDRIILYNYKEFLNKSFTF